VDLVPVVFIEVVPVRRREEGGRRREEEEGIGTMGRGGR